MESFDRRGQMKSSAPECVKRAAVLGKHAALSAMGRAGARAAQQKRFEKSVFLGRTTERKEDEELFRREQAGEDIIQPDSIN
jgi:hypothetical protein